MRQLQHPIFGRTPHYWVLILFSAQGAQGPNKASCRGILRILLLFGLLPVRHVPELPSVGSILITDHSVHKPVHQIRYRFWWARALRSHVRAQAQGTPV
jgi:hypothetical protein